MDSLTLDNCLSNLQSNKNSWATLPITNKISYLDQTIKLTVDHAEEWANAGSEAKGLNTNSPLSGEEWLGGPYAFLNWLQYMKNTLNAIAAGKSAIHKVKLSEAKCNCCRKKRNS